MTQTPTADQQFRSALAAVRGHPLDAGRVPAFSLPQVQSSSSPAHAGEVYGPAGDIWSTAGRLRDGSLSPEQVIDRCLENIQAHSARLGAFEQVAPRADLLAALAASDPAAPLYGIPIGIKDVIDAVGFRTTGSSVAAPPREPLTEGQAVARLRAAGALILGKTVTHEFALGVTTPQSHNPWDMSRVPGGSSGGAVISLVTGMALGALGTDTRASIRVPPALSGAVGFRPTTGLVPVDGWMPLSWSMDVLAPMARSVRDIALLMDVLTASQRFRASLPGSLSGARIGVSEAFMGDVEPDVAARFHEAIAKAAQAGATVVPFAGPSHEDLHLANVAGMILSRAEAAHAHQEAGTDLARCIPEVRDQLWEAREVPATDYVRCLRIRGELYERFMALMTDVDFLAMPTSKVVAPRREAAGQFLLVLSENCITWSLLGFPAISLFAGLAEGLPCGLQLVGRPGCDPALVAAAHAFERVLPPIPEWAP